MKDKSSIFYKIDFLSATPQLRIYGNNNYKTSFGAIFSIIALLGSLAFILYSFLDYIKFNSPSIVYWRDSYGEMVRTFRVNESLMMFQILDSSNNVVEQKDADLLAELVTFEKNKGETSAETISLEKCELGKNIDLSFTEAVEEFQQINNDRTSNYWCVSRNKAITLYYEPKTGYNYLRISVILHRESEYIPSNLKTHYVIQEDFISHFNKSNPIDHQQSTGNTPNYGTDKYTISTMPMEYLAYESDNGIIFETAVNHKGYMLGSVDTELASKDDFAYDYENDLKNYGYSKIGDLRVEVSQKNSYEKYKRTYPKIQSILADVKTMVDVILVAGSIITNLVATKKMSIDLIRSLINRNTDYDKYYTSPKQNADFYEVFKEVNNPGHYLYDLNKTKNSFAGKSNSIIGSSFYKASNPEIVKTIISRNKDINIKNEKKMKKIGVCSIIKSYCCCQDMKTKIVNASHESILQLLCVDKLFEKILTYEKMFYLLPDEEKYKINFMDIREFKALFECLRNFDGPISNEVKIQNTKNMNVELSKSETDKE